MTSKREYDGKNIKKNANIEHRAYFIKKARAVSSGIFNTPTKAGSSYTVIPVCDNNGKIVKCLKVSNKPYEMLPRISKKQLKHNHSIRLSRKRECKLIDKALNSIGLPQYRFSIGKEKEQAVCLVPSIHYWYVFDFERNQKRNLRHYKNIELAAAEFARRVVLTDVEEKEIISAIIGATQ